MKLQEAYLMAGGIDRVLVQHAWGPGFNPSNVQKKKNKEKKETTLADKGPRPIGCV